MNFAAAVEDKIADFAELVAVVAAVDLQPLQVGSPPLNSLRLGYGDARVRLRRRRYRLAGLRQNRSSNKDTSEIG
jgi:hypothetical protein